MFIRNIKIIYTILLLTFLSLSNLIAKEITIFHMNDTHGRAEESKTVIGYAKISTFINEARKKNPNILVLDAGDTFHGTTFANLSKGKSIVDILNAMKIDGLAAGNHDFNYSTKTLLDLEKRAKFPILAANVIDEKGKNIFYSNYIKTIDGIKIGVFGLATPETMYKTHPKNVEKLVFLEPKQIAQKQVMDLKRKGADIIIAVTHLGIDDSTQIEQRSSYLTQVEGIDIIIDGHSHTVLKNGIVIGNTTIVQAGSLGSNLGVVKINIENVQGVLVRTITSSLLEKESFTNIIPDKRILNIIAKYTKEQNKIIDKKVTNIPITLNGERDSIRAGETNLGLLIADALRENAKTDIAFVNSGGIRTSINEGEVTYKDILSVLPFGNYGITLEMTGRDILEVLEFSVSHLPKPSGGFLQVSGITFDINTQKPIGKKIANAKIQGEKLNFTKIYTVASLDFIVSGGDGYKMFLNKKILSNEAPLNEVLVNYLIKKAPTLKDYDFTKRMNIKN